LFFVLFDWSFFILEKFFNIYIYIKIKIKNIEI